MSRAAPHAHLPPFAPDWALFLDVDGTLLEIAEHPDAVEAAPDLRETLGHLRAALDGAVALVSGRAIAELDRIFAPLRLAAAGQHGLEWRDGAGRVQRHAVEPVDLDTAREAIARFVRAHPGTLFEDKGMALALHYRRAPHVEGEADALIADLAARMGPTFEIQRGKMVLELKPGGRNKGSVVEEFMAAPPFAGRRPVFVGDDVTDEDGFRAVQAAGGLAIKVGPGETCAAWRLPDASVVSTWLAECVREAARMQQERSA